jgi:hypothetical protein
LEDDADDGDDEDDDNGDLDAGFTEEGSEGDGGAKVIE